mmetsp:Transcript_23465/g.35624  ORF Transcript_23465/g.35624 Transcript_23465/m.35624 type:complete len:106 (+) Transcript_23465:306-623(+)
MVMLGMIMITIAQLVIHLLEQRDTNNQKRKVKNSQIMRLQVRTTTEMKNTRGGLLDHRKVININNNNNNNKEDGAYASLVRRQMNVQKKLDGVVVVEEKEEEDNQ